MAQVAFCRRLGDPERSRGVCNSRARKQKSQEAILRRRKFEDASDGSYVDF